MKAAVKNALQIQSENWNDKYLGLPVHVGKSRKKAFSFVKNAIAGRVYGWKEKLIAKVGKEMLVTTVARAIPTFSMSCFYLTKSFCDEISSLIGNYWWSQQDKKIPLHWLSWEKFAQPKAMGGLGFRDMHTFYLAMLSRQGWRILQNPLSLCARILKARYFPNSTALEAIEQDGISYSWRSILQGLKVVKQGCIWRVGDGTRINISTDPWIPRPWSRQVITPRGANLLTYVNELIDLITGGWDEQLIKDTLCVEDARHILQIPLRDGIEDFVAWHFDPKGKHSVRSAYKLQMELNKQYRTGGLSTSA